MISQHGKQKRSDLILLKHLEKLSYYNKMIKNRNIRNVWISVATPTWQVLSIK